MQFVHQPLTWGFFLVLVPLLIHLINMMRHRRVKWAAMEFLLQSYKKHRKWIWLRQLLLLLMRMLAVALAVAMLAQWVSRGQWLDLLGGKPTHHYIILDDSYSMSDRLGGASAFEIGLAAVQRIGARAVVAAQSGPQKFTLIRMSRAARMSPERDDSLEYDQVLDFNASIVSADFDVTLEARRNAFEVTELAAGPGPALALLRELVGLSGDEHRHVYIVSDFRTNQWENPVEVRGLLQEIEQSPAEIHLVGCVRDIRQNLAVVDVRPADGTRAAGVPLLVDVAVRNFGPDAARNVQLKVRTDFYDSQLAQTVPPDQLWPKSDELPTVLINEIEAGQTVTRSVQVFFPTPGQHVVEAALQDDSVAADNRRWCVIDFPEGEPVLLVDGSPGQSHAFFLQAVFEPGGRANTGVRPEVNTPAFLRDALPEMLDKYRAIYLLDAPRLDDRAVANLEDYVRGGGGLGIFMGPEVNLAFYANQLYRDGHGLMPLPLEREDVLLAEDEEKVPDIEPAEHPVFRVFLGERNPFIRQIRVERYLRPDSDWRPAPESSVRIAAWLRNRMPLAVEHRFGEGRVMAVLTTAAPLWNNWGNDPSFVVMVLQLQSYLAASQRAVEQRLVGSPISVAVDAKTYRQDMVFVTPGETPQSRTLIERVGMRSAPESPVLEARVGSSGTLGTAADEGETDRSGIYEAWPVILAGEADVRRYALNVDPLEGDLALLAGKPLLDKLEPVKAGYKYAEEYEYEFSRLGGNNRSLLLMVILVGLLLTEQLMGYGASYHPARPQSNGKTKIRRPTA